MRFRLSVFLAFLAVMSCAAQVPKKAALVVACADQKASYAPSEKVSLTVAIENRGASAFYVYQPLEWGWTGLWFGLLDATGKTVRLKSPDLDTPPPPPPSSKSDFVEVDPEYYYGRHLDFRLSDYKLRAGTYFIAFKYQGNYSGSEGFGLPILAWEDGEITSNRIEISVR